MMDLTSHIDYLTVGHICYDLTPDGPVIGGSVAYAGGTAQVLGCRTAVVTSSKIEETWEAALPGVSIHRIPSGQTTLFENVYSSEGRTQTVHAVADNIARNDIPAIWQRASIVHLAPIANEVDPSILRLFSNSLVGLTPQGWMRRWDEKGKVSARAWTGAETYLRLAAAVIIGEEDLLDHDMLDYYRKWSRLLVMTQGENGCTLFLGEESHHFPTLAGSAIDTTGAGDIFAAAFLIRLFQTNGNPFEAARFANEAATMSIAVEGLEAKMRVLSKWKRGN
jgi:sugar/nucleoside kinase (ribokinase family)